MSSGAAADIVIGGVWHAPLAVPNSGGYDPRDSLECQLGPPEAACPKSCLLHLSRLLTTQVGILVRNYHILSTSRGPGFKERQARV